MTLLAGRASRTRLGHSFRAVFAGALLAAASAHAFKLQAIGGAEASAGPVSRQAAGFLSLFSLDIHERITRRAYEQAGVPLAEGVIAGVRWNDNPPVLRAGPLAGACDTGCWTSMLRVDRVALEVLARRERSIPAFRSHFGDMQFLHAMATREGERAGETREKALRWAEFAYRVARGEIDARANVFELHDSDTAMARATREWVSALFRSPGKRLWRVQDVFSPGAADVRQVAFGSLLHLVEDSYSASHVERAARRFQANGCPSYNAVDAVIAFHTYVGQDTERHALCDDAPDWLEEPRAGSPVDALAGLVRAYADGRPWADVKVILEEKVFRVTDEQAASHPGACFAARPDAAPGEDPPLPAVALDPGCRTSK